jgi:hypothetical protein
MVARRYSPLRLPALYLERNDMGALGVGPTSRIARAWNRRRWQPHLEYRQRLEQHLPELERERRGAGRANGSIRIENGWALDESRSLPHLQELLDEMNAVIEERGLRPWKDWGKPFLKDILPERSWERYGSILDFASSAEVLEPMARHARLVPHLSGSVPPGVRLMESSTEYDPQPDGPWRSSQLWHIDYHADPLIYVIVAVRDIGPDDGPLNFLDQATSDRVSAALGYRSRGAPYRVADEVMQAHVGRDEVRRFVAPRGTVMFLDSSRCFHFGSRKPANPRYQLQYAYLSPVRNDFSELIRPQVSFPVRSHDPLSRRLALDRELRGE